MSYYKAATEIEYVMPYQKLLPKATDSSQRNWWEYIHHLEQQWS